jgi:hypothetical protein
MEMNVLIVAEKPAASKAIARITREHWPTADVTFVHAVPYGNIKFSYPRGRNLRDYPLLSNPSYKLSAWDAWVCPPYIMAVDGTLSQGVMNPSLFTTADLIVYACDPDHTGAAAFDVLLAQVFPDDRALACPALKLNAIDEDSLQQAFSNMRAFGEACQSSLEYGRIKRYFDWNWNVNALAVLGEVQRRAGVPSGAPPLSKYALQLLYAMREESPRSYGQWVSLMQRWPGTGRYQYQTGEWRPRLGSPASVGQIMENLAAAGLLEPISNEGKQVLGVSSRGRTLLGLLHPDCEDPDLPFRLNAWCEKGEAAKPAIDRYIKTFFGKQLRFFG